MKMGLIQSSDLPSNYKLSLGKFLKAFVYKATFTRTLSLFVVGGGDEKQVRRGRIFAFS